MNVKRRRKNSGFTLMELLIVIGILGILILIVLAVVVSSRTRANDIRIKNGVRQLRLLAESVYDTQGGSYVGWSELPEVADKVNTITADIANNYGSGADVTIMRDSQEDNFCISAPKRSDEGMFYCIDATGVLQETTEECPDYLEDGSPLRCGG